MIVLISMQSVDIILKDENNQTLAMSSDFIIMFSDMTGKQVQTLQEGNNYVISVFDSTRKYYDSNVSITYYPDLRIEVSLKLVIVLEVTLSQFVNNSMIVFSYLESDFIWNLTGLSTQLELPQSFSIGDTKKFTFVDPSNSFAQIATELQLTQLN